MTLDRSARDGASRFTIAGVVFAIILLSLTVRAQAPGSLSGDVICNDTHSPARFALVRAVSTEFDSKSNGHTVSTQTGPDGSFLIENLPPGEYAVEVDLRGYLDPLQGFSVGDVVSSLQHDPKKFSSLVRTSISPGATSVAHITLSRGALISGKIAYDDGGAAQGLKVSAIPTTTSDDLESRDSGPVAYTDDAGSFRLSGLAPGNFTIRVEMPAGIAGPLMLPVYLGDTFKLKDAKVLSIAGTSQVSGVEMRLPVTKLHRVYGNLISSNHLSTSITLTPLSEGQGSAPLTVLTSRDGQFMFPGVPEGTYVLRFAQDSKQNEKTVIVSGQDLEVRIENAHEPANGGAR